MIQEVSNNSLYSTSSTTSTDSNDLVSKDQFLKLLTYQLKNQNPLDPKSSDDFSADLAQFSQLEQLTEMSSLMGTMNTTMSVLTQSVTNSGLSGMLGNVGKMASEEFNFDGTNPVKLGYNLQYSASDVEVTITDESGNQIRSFSMSGSDLQSGEHELAWDGTNDDGDIVESGNYKIKVEATASDGSDISYVPYIYGTIESVRFTGEGTMLVVGGVEVPQEYLMDISVPA